MAGNIKENSQELDRLIKKIAEKVAGIMPQDWSRVAAGYFLVGEAGVGHQQIVALCGAEEEYRDLMEESWDDFDLQDAALEIKELFEQLHDLCGKAGDDWVEATLSVKRNGSLKMDFIYEAIREYDNFFVDDWRSRYLV